MATEAFGQAQPSGASAFAQRGVWFAPARPKPTASQQLFCLPYAGGGASVFARWQQRLPEIDVWSVELPGRQLRAAEPLERSLMTLAHGVADAIERSIAGDFSLLGCSMGGLLAFEVARLLQARCLRTPRHLFVLASNPPAVQRVASMVHKLGDDDLLSAVARAFAPIPQALLEDPDMRPALLRVLRADIEVVETYTHEPGPRLKCPLTYFYATRDPSIAKDASQAWSHHTAAGFRACEIEGDHFFVQTAADAFLAQLFVRLRQPTKE